MFATTEGVSYLLIQGKNHKNKHLYEVKALHFPCLPLLEVSNLLPCVPSMPTLGRASRLQTALWIKDKMINQQMINSQISL